MKILMSFKKYRVSSSFTLLLIFFSAGGVANGEEDSLNMSSLKSTRNRSRSMNLIRNSKR